MLNAIQQGYATEALAFVSPCIDYFLNHYPCLREVVDPEELNSAALFACATAAKTYDPNKAGISAYFSRAIIHELLKSCRREIRSRSRSVYRVSLTVAERRQAVRCQPLADAAVLALTTLTERDREWIEAHCFEQQSVRSLARQHGVSARQATKILRARLSKLRKATVDQPHWEPVQDED